MRLIKAIAWALAWLVLSVAALWAAGALYFDFPVSDLGGPAAVLFALALLAAVIFVRGKLLKLVICLGGFALVTGWWLTIKPTNNRVWQPDVARTAWAEISATRSPFTTFAIASTARKTISRQVGTRTRCGSPGLQAGSGDHVLGLALDGASDRQLLFR